MSDIVEELRQGALTRDDYRWVAAYEIERLRAALEEAAKVVDEMPLSHPGNAAETALECAAALRALKNQ